MYFDLKEEDYYTEAFSYYRLIMRELGKEDTMENALLKEIYNGILGSLKEEDRKVLYCESVIMSGLLEHLVSKEENRKEYFNTLYECYLKPLTYFYVSGNYDMMREMFLYIHNQLKEKTHYSYLLNNKIILNNCMKKMN